MRRAARPVGAPSIILVFLALRMDTRARKMVVFPVPGSAGENGNLGEQGLSDSLGLGIGKSEPCLLLSPGNGFFDLNRRQGGLSVQQRMQGSRQGLFGPGAGRQLHPVLGGGDQVAALQQSVNPLVDVIGIGFEQIGRLNHQFPPVDVVVPLILGFLHGVEDTSLDAFGPVVGKSEVQAIRFAVLNPIPLTSRMIR